MCIVGTRCVADPDSRGREAISRGPQDDKGSCSMAGYKEISVSDTLALASSDPAVVLLDVRRRDEYDGPTGHLERALLIPVEELPGRVDELIPYKGKTIVAYCRTGIRSGRAAAFLNGRGYSVMNMAGGIVEWLSRGLPVEGGG